MGDESEEVEEGGHPAAETPAGERPAGEGPAAEGPAGEGPAAEAHAGEGHDGGEGHDPSGGHGERLHTIIALTIAVISVVGAVISWRVEVHASAATDLDENAVQASISRSGLQNDAQQEAYAAAASYNRYIQVQDDAQQLTGQACGDNSDTSTITGADALADCILTTPLSEYDVPAYISQSDPRQYDVQSYAADVEAANRYEKNVNSAEYQTQAADERHGEYRMLWLSLLLVAALALATVAQLERRRGWSLRLAIPGWVLLAVSVGLLIGWEH